MRSFLVAAGFFVAALALRLVRLGDRSFWLDEGGVAWAAAQPFDVLLRNEPFHPPLYPLLLNAWASLGPWFESDDGRRFLSALAGALIVGFSVWLVSRLRLPGAWFVGLLSVTSALSIWYSQEQRSVELTALALLVACGLLALLAAPRFGIPVGPVAVLWPLYVLVAALGVYLHYGAIPVLVAGNAAFLVFARPRGRVLVAWLASNVAVAVLCLPLAPLLLHAIELVGDLNHRFNQQAIVLFVGGGLAAAVAAAAGWFVFRRWPVLFRQLVAVGSVLFLVALATMMLTDQGTSIKRHIALVSPIGVVIAGAALASLGLAQVWKAVLVLIGMPALVLALFVFPKEQWRDVAALIMREEQPGDVIVLYQGYNSVVFDRYYHGASKQLDLSEPVDTSALPGQIASAPRVWLIENKTTAPPTLVPVVEQNRPRLESRGYYRIDVYLYGSR